MPRPPHVLGALRERGLVADEVVEVLIAADELGSLGELVGGEERSRAIRDVLAALERRLRALGDPPWQAPWVAPADDRRRGT